MNHTTIIIVIVLIFLPLLFVFGRNVLSFCLGLIGYQHSLRGDKAGALRRFELAVKVNPKDARAWGSMGLALAHLNRAEEGARMAIKATELTPRDPFAWSVYADVLVHAERYQDAARCYQRAIELGPWMTYSRERLNELKEFLAVESPNSTVRSNLEEKSKAPLYDRLPALPTKPGRITDWDFSAILERARVLFDLGHMLEAEWELIFIKEHRPPSDAIDEFTRKVLSDAESLHQRVRGEMGNSAVSWLD